MAITTINLSSLDGNNGFRLDGAAASDYSGNSVSNAGDVNGDGFDDVIVGAHGAGLYINSRYGSSYVVFGKTSGFDAALNLSSLDGSNGFSLDGAGPYDQSGFSVSSAGDVNGDGFDDVLVGSPTDSDYSGFCYVVFGKASSFAATLPLSSLDGNNGFRLNSVTRGDDTGISVSSAGDVNGDGFDDVIVGAPRSNVSGDLYSDYAGSSYVVFGKAAGFGARLDLSSLDGNNGIRLDGAAYDFSGRSVSSAGDVNGDGFADVLVGAPRADPNGYDSGSSYVVFGRSNFGGGNVIKGTSGDDILKGTSAADIFEAGDGNDRMIGRGGADVFNLQFPVVLPRGAL